MRYRWSDWLLSCQLQNCCQNLDWHPSHLVNRTIAEMDMQAIDERRKNRKQHLPEDMY